ncbi:MAG: RagB/SusD family nutrient uptake outer membrane protein, partial [Bacteroidota bacterium]
KKMRFKATLVIMLFVGFSCTEDELSLVNPNEVVIETFYQDGDELTAGVYSIYASLQAPGLWGREYFFTHDLRSDDNEAGGGQLEAPRARLLDGTNDAANAVASSVWNSFYQVILRSNAIIQAGPGVEDIEESLRTTLIAEAKFFRGMAYYELASIWGGVPIYLEPAQTFNGFKPRSSMEESFQQAIQDLTEAAANLPSKSASEPGRYDRGAALAYLGRAQMFAGNYAAAKTAFDAIVASGEYALFDEYDDNFQEEAEYGVESVMEIGFADVGDFNWGGYGSGDGIGNERTVRSQEYSAVGWRNLIPSLSLLEDFERVSKGDAKDDPRFAKSFFSIGDTFNNGESVLEETSVQGNTVNFEGVDQKISWRKYSIMYKTDPGGYLNTGINHRVIRYAEVLLNLAECELETGNPSAAVALLNQVRARPSVDMPPYPTANYPVSTNDEVMAAIIHEKRVEMSSEQIRNRDILRWRSEGKLSSDPISYFVANRHEMLPIPQAEIDNNSEITQADQNPGY